MLTTLRATREFRYGTRRLMAGEVFEATSRDARLLLATRKVQAVRAPAIVPPPPPAVKAKIEAAVAPPPPPANVGAMTMTGGTAPLPGASEAEVLAAARADYETAFGKKPFHSWDARTLRMKIAEKPGIA